MNLLLAGLLVVSAVAVAAVPILANGRVPRWQKVIHLSSAQWFAAWGIWLWWARVALPWPVAASTIIGAGGCIAWSAYYVRMMRRNRPVVE